MGVEIVRVPDIGDSQSVEIIEICVAVGDTVDIEDSLIVLESDKASMEVPSPLKGTIKAITVKEGDKVSEGDVIIELEVNAQSSAAIEAVSVTAPVDIQSAIASSDAKAAPQATSVIETLTVPDIGDSAAVEVIEVSVAVGDVVAIDDILVVLESDKASMEVPAIKAGKIIKVVVKEGDKVAQGSVLVEIESVVTMEVSAPIKNATPVSSVPPKAVAADVESKAVKSQSTSHSAVTTKDDNDVYAGPAARMFARRFGVDLKKVFATGPRGRTLKEDIEAFISEYMSNPSSSNQNGLSVTSAPVIDFSKFGDIDVIDMTRVQKLTAENMVRNWLSIPHVTQFDDADITDLELFRQTLKAQADKKGVKLTPLPFILKACAVGLQQFPQFNVSVDASGTKLIKKNYINIGFAMDTPIGLMVPVVKNADKKSIWEIAADLTELMEKGKNKKLKADDLQGGCFTISSLGPMGGTGFTPIVNAPEVAILGISKASVKPIWDGSAFVPRTMLPLCLSYDHRAINGVDGGKLMAFLTAALADLKTLIM